ncbi:hypothetical protein PTKIN_Ptkin07bG0029800 [Pterospermum kingtungense]
MYHKHQLPCLHCQPHDYIRMVQHMIERCLLFRMGRVDCVKALAKHANIEPIITLTALATIVSKVVVNGSGMFYYYTHVGQMDFYIGYHLLWVWNVGCYQHQKMSSCGFNAQDARIDAEQGYYMPLINRKDTDVHNKALNPLESSNNVSHLLSYIPDEYWSSYAY